MKHKILMKNFVNINFVYSYTYFYILSVYSVRILTKKSTFDEVNRVEL